MKVVIGCSSDKQQTWLLWLEGRFSSLSLTMNSCTTWTAGTLTHHIAGIFLQIRKVYCRAKTLLSEVLLLALFSVLALIARLQKLSSVPILYTWINMLIIKVCLCQSCKYSGLLGNVFRVYMHANVSTQLLYSFLCYHFQHACLTNCNSSPVDYCACLHIFFFLIVIFFLNYYFIF